MTGRPRTAIARAVARRRQAEQQGLAEDPWQTHNDPGRPARDGSTAGEKHVARAKQAETSTAARIAKRIRATVPEQPNGGHNDPGGQPRAGTAGERIAARHGIGRSK